jgi:outer membrane protein TolC
VFDGKYGKTIRTRLGRQEELSRLALRSAMEETVYQIIIAYYDVTRIQALIKATESNMELYAERKKIASVKYQVGKEAKSDYLITQSDENKIHTALLQLELQRRQALIKLNALCSLPADDNWYASDSLTIAGTSTLDTLLQTRITGNMAFQMAQQHVYIIDETIKESLAKKYPVVQLSGELSAGRGLSQSGFLRSYQQAGVAGGVTLNWSLYNGDRNNRLIQERKIQLLQQQLVTDWTQQQVQASVHNNDVTWRLNKQMLELEIANKEVAQEMIDISQERYRQGKTTILETKEAQKNWEDAQMHSIEALYRIKVAEVTILKEVGELIK